MDDIQLKKEKFKSILKGKSYDSLNIEEAKKRLKETDIGIDIREIIKLINNPSKNQLKLFLITLISDPQIIAYFSPVIKMFLFKLFMRE